MENIIDYESEFKRQYLELFHKADKLEFDPKCLIFRCDSEQKCYMKRRYVENGSIKYSKLFYLMLGFLVLFFSRLIINSEMHIQSATSSVNDLIFFIIDYFNINEQSLKGNRCAVQLSSFIMNTLLPPANCSMCRGLRTVKKLNNLSKERFEKQYAYSGRPVVITDAMLNWTATEKFGFEFFAHLYNKSSSNLSLNCQFFPYLSKFNNLLEVFQSGPDKDKMLGSGPWYIGWGNCDSDVAEVLRQHYSTPYFLPEGSQLSGIDWIFMGSPGYGAHMHIDRVGNPSWQAQVRGSKLWTLVPPFECYFECQASIKVVVKKGEMIVLDTDQWHHSTLIIGDETSITIGSEYD